MDIQWNKLKLKVNKKNVLSSGSIKLNGITGIYGDETKNVLLKEIWKRLTSTPKTNKFTTYQNKIKRFEDFFIRISLSPRSLRSQTVWKILSEYYEIKYYKKASVDDIKHFLKIFELNPKILGINFSKLEKKEAAIVSLISELIKGNMIYFIESIDNFLSPKQFVNLIAYFSNMEINSAKTLCFTANDPEFAVSCSDVLIFSNGNVEAMYRSSSETKVDDIIDTIQLGDDDFLENSEEIDSLKDSNDVTSDNISIVESNDSMDENSLEVSEEQINNLDDKDSLNTEDRDSLEEESMKDSKHDESSILSVKTNDSTEYEKNDTVSTKSNISDENDSSEKENSSRASNQSNCSDESTNTSERKQKIKINIHEPETAENISDSQEETSNFKGDKEENDFSNMKKDETSNKSTGTIEIHDTSSISESTKESINKAENSESAEMDRNSGHSSISIRADTTTSELNIASDASKENSVQNSSENLDDEHSETTKGHDVSDIQQNDVSNNSNSFSNYSSGEKENIPNSPAIVENEGYTDKENFEISNTKANMVDKRNLSFSLRELLEENGFVKDELILDEETTQKGANCLIIFHKAIFLAKVFSITKQTFHASFNSSAAKVLFHSIWDNFTSFTSLCVLSILLICLFAVFPFGERYLIKLLINGSEEPYIVLGGISTLLLLIVYLPFSSSVCLLSGFLRDLHYDNRIAFTPKTTAIQVIGLFLNFKNLALFFLIVLYLCIVLGFMLAGPIVVFVISLLPFCVILEQLYSLVSSPTGALISFVIETLVIFPPCVFLFTMDTSKFILMHALAPLVSNLNSLSAIIVQNTLNSKIINKVVTNDNEIKNLKKLLLDLNRYNPLAKQNIKYIVTQTLVVLLLTGIYILFYLKPLILRRSK